MGWGEKAIEIRSVDKGLLDGVFMHKRANKLKFLCERNDKGNLLFHLAPAGIFFWKSVPKFKLVFSFLRFGSITIKCPGLLHVSSTALNLLENSTCLQSHVCQGLFLFLSSVYIVSLFKNWDGPYLYSAGHSVLTKLVPNQTVMSVRPISGWLKVGLPIKMRTINRPWANGTNIASTSKLISGLWPNWYFSF